jgi:hypothetical protein
LDRLFFQVWQGMIRNLFAYWLAEIEFLPAAPAILSIK